MKSNYVRIISFAAFTAILFLQGLWLYNTYKLLETDFKNNVSSLFISSLEKEAVSRIEDSEKKGKNEGKIIEGVSMKNNQYTNNRALQDFLYKEDYLILLGQVDSIFNEEIKSSYDHLNHSFVLTDSLGNQKQSITFGEKNPSTLFSYKETIKLRNIDPEYMTLTITSPYKIIFGKMILMLIASFVLAIIVVYGMILQINTIRKQNKIAEMRQDFSHAMIHDMKNPITSILMGVNSLKSGKADAKPSVKDRYYAIITQESERMLKLANRVLETAQFEGQQVVLDKEQINLPDLITSLTDKYLLLNTTKKIHFQVDLDGVETIDADLHHINEAFDNLIDNAIKYSKENVEPEINITASINGKNTQIRFKDNGIGISAGDQKKIFQKFERSMSVIKNQKKISGFGLGLNYVYQVIKAHGGSIRVNSRLGSYSEFIINLPNDGKDKTVVS